MQPQWFETNRKSWDERVPIHLKSPFYRIEAFKAGESPLYDFEHQELGSVKDCELLHLQCHFGLDTLSWARAGARVTGLDFSEPAIQAAQGLADELALPADFVCGNVYDAPELLSSGRFDIVYTGRGALIWLPDIKRWAGIVARLLKPGGRFYMHEFHPAMDVFADDSLAVEYSYFHEAEPRRWEGTGSYADFEAETENNVSLEWSHPIGDVVTALIQAGLRIELLKERPDACAYRRWPFMREVKPGDFRLPEELPALPLTYSLKAVKADPVF